MASGYDLGFEVEDLNLALNSVTFEDVQDHYQPGEDIFVIYSINDTFKPSSRDWIGLYQQNWENPKDYLTFEWAQKQARDEHFKELRSVLFQSKYLKLASNDKEYYQFLYITKHSEIAGVSKKFRLCNYCPGDDGSSAFVCFERPLDDGIGSLTFIERSSSQPKGLLETFELIKSFSEPKVLEPKPVKKYHDTVTLTSSFDQPKSGQYNVSTTMDPLLQEYLSNREKALVPVGNRSLVPYGSYKPIFTLCNNGKDTGVNIEELLTPIATSIFNSKEQVGKIKRKVSSKLSSGNQYPKVSNLSLQSASGGSFPFNTTAGKKITEKQKSCSDCRKRRQDVKTLKDRLSQLREETSLTENELDCRQQAIDMKDMLLGDLSSQVRNLVQENNNLTAANDKLYTEKHRLKGLTRENKRSALDSSKAAKEIRKLTRDRESLAEHASQLEHLLKSTDSKNSQLASKNQYFEDELQSLKTQRAELEQVLDDVMYTLSLQGYSKLIDATGNVTDLTKKKGSVLELQGWTMQHSRRTERQLATIGHQEATITELQGECENLRMMIRENNNTKEQLEKLNKDEKDRVFILQEEVRDIGEKLKISEEKQASLSRLLINEKRQKLQMVKQYQEGEKALKNRVKSLTSALKMSAKKTTTCESSTQASQRSSTAYATQTDPSKSYAMTGATGALHSMCDYVTSSVFSAKKAFEKKPNPYSAEGTVGGHSSRWTTAPGSPGSLAQDPAVLSWSEQVDLEQKACPTPSQESVNSFKASFRAPKSSGTGMAKPKKVKVFGGKAKKPRKFVYKAYTPGKAKPVSTDYTPFLFGSNSKASD